MTQELLDAQTTQVAAYQPFYAELIQLEKDNAALVFDYESPKGNKEARSHVFALRKTKGSLERVRKEAKAESLRIGRAIDSEAAAIELRIENMISVHQTKIDEIEQREKDRVAALQKRLDEISMNLGAFNSVAELKDEIARVEQIAIGTDWQEMMSQAATAKESTLAKLAESLQSAIRRDEEVAELARLRAEAEARAQAERDAAIAKAAAEKAQREAEEKMAAEAARAAKAIADAKAEAERKEAAAALALKQERERALAEQEAAARRESELRIQAEQAEQRRIAMEAEAERQKVAAAARAEAEKQAAIKAEQDRIAAEAARVKREAEEREANKAHCARINREAMAALIEGGISEECAKQCVKLIAQGKVNHVQITY